MSRVRGAGAAIAALGAVAVLVAVLRCVSGEPVPIRALVETFDSSDLEAWEATAANDLREGTADVVPAPGGGQRLRLRADSRGTDDRTVKYLGVRHREPIEIGPGRSVGVELDWNGQQNGSYLSAALVLSPGNTTGNPLDGLDWLKVEYVGVPPGRNARLLIVLRTGGRERILHDGGWPVQGRDGRPIALQRLLLTTTSSGFTLAENGRLLFSAGAPLTFGAAFLYLQLASHSNYAARELFFDNVVVR